MAIFEMDLGALKQYQGIRPQPENFDAYWVETLQEVTAAGLKHELIKEDFAGIWTRGVAN